MQEYVHQTVDFSCDALSMTAFQYLCVKNSAKLGVDKIRALGKENHVLIPTFEVCLSLIKKP